MGATIPDIFLPFTLTLFRDYYWDVRLVTHSLLGAVTLNLFLGAIGAIIVLPAIIKFLRKRSDDPRTYTFAGVDIIKDRPGKAVILYSVLIGIISHLILDLFYHLDNPILYPLSDNNLILFNDLKLTSTIFRIITVFGFLMLAYFHWLRQPKQ